MSWGSPKGVGGRRLGGAGPSGGVSWALLSPSSQFWLALGRLLAALGLLFVALGPLLAALGPLLASLESLLAALGVLLAAP